MFPTPLPKKKKIFKYITMTIMKSLNQLSRSLLLECAELLGIGLRPNTFSYAELRSATDNFNPSNKLGEGGFGPVFKVKYIIICNVG